MTNIISAYTKLAHDASMHIRITDALAQGKTELAATLLTDRMLDFIRDRGEGDDLGTPELNDAVDAIRNDFGPLIQVTLAGAITARLGQLLGI